jgi:hypothetical protein
MQICAFQIGKPTLKCSYIHSTVKLIFLPKNCQREIREQENRWLLLFVFIFALIVARVRPNLEMHKTEILTIAMVFCKYANGRAPGIP